MPQTIRRLATDATAVPAAGTPVRADRRPLLVTGAAVLVWSVIAAWVGYHAIDPSWAGAHGMEVARGSEAGLVTIVTVNLGASLLLFSGVATAGLTTFVAVTCTASYVGATMAVAVHNTGASGVLGQVWAYLFLELGAMLLAAVAGAYPVVAVALPTRGPKVALHRRYVDAARTSLVLIAMSAGLVVLAALVETSVAR